MIMEMDVVSRMKYDMGHEDQHKGHVQAKRWYLEWYLRWWMNPDIGKSTNFVQNKDSRPLPQTSSASCG